MLAESDGLMYSVTNEETRNSMKLFEEAEGCDIHPAAGVALGALIQAVETGKVSPEERVLLNVTGGGEEKLRNDYDLHFLEPFAELTDTEINGPDAGKKVASLLRTL